MICATSARKGGPAPTPRAALWDLDEAYAELADLCDRYIDGSVWKRRKVRYWKQVRILGESISHIAADVGCDRRVIARHVEDVARGLWAEHDRSRSPGHPVERLLGPRPPVRAHGVKPPTPRSRP